jgi:ubiquitin conjugation factor E4 B
VRDPDKYQFKPKELLAQICSVYLHLFAADKAGVFAASIAADGRSYRPAMFAEAALVLRQFQLLSESEVSVLVLLGGGGARVLCGPEALRWRRLKV